MLIPKNFKFNDLDIAIILVVGVNGPLSVSQIRDKVPIAPNNLTRHLKTLEELKLLKVVDNGKGRHKEISLNLDDEKSASLLLGLVTYFTYDLIGPEEKAMIKEKNDIDRKMLEKVKDSKP
jgi:DNA-binding MarR family transcriptional regulator